MQLFKRKKSIVGLDIGSKACKIVQLAYNKTAHPTLEKCDIINTGTEDEEFEGNLKYYMKENKVANSLVASSIDDVSMKIRKMELPKMPDADMIEAIKWNFRDIVDGDVEDFTINFSRIKEYEDHDIAKVEMMAYAISKKVVQDFQFRIQKLGLEPFYIEPSAVCLASTLERNHGDDDLYTAGVNIGHHYSIFYVIGKRVFVFSRPLTNINLELYEKDKKGFNQKLAIEIQKSIDTFKVNFKMEEIHHLYLSGGGALIPEIDTYLNTNLGIKTEMLNPFATLSNVEAFEGIEPPLFAQAVGLAYLEP